MRSYAFLLFPIEWPQIVSLDYISAGPVAEWLRRQSIEEGGRRQKKAEEGRGTSSCAVLMRFLLFSTERAQLE